MFKQHFRDNKGLLVSLALVFAATLGSAIFLTYTLLSLRSFIRQGERDFSAVLRLQNLLGDLQAAESSQRGYIITGDDKYLGPYNDAVKRVPTDVKQLQTVMALDPYRHQVDQLSTLAAKRLRQLQYTIDQRKTKSLAETAATVHFDVGKQTMDQARSLLSQIQQSEFNSVKVQERRSAANLRLSLIMTPIVVAFVLVMCLLIMRYFHKAISKERLIEGSKNEFLSLASHQLRTPATNVKQYLHLVLDGYFGEVEPAQREALEIADRNNNIEISIVNDLLNIAKIDLNQIHLRLEPVNAGRLVRDVIAQFRPTIKQNGQRISYQGGTKAVGPVVLDPTHFRSVLENLLDNASKYTPRGGRIQVQAHRTVDNYVLRVQDDGVGISPADQSHLFKKFSRIQNPLSDTVEGSGLGLYWVRRVVELHGGRITVESAVDKGALFEVTLPLKPTGPKTA